MGRELCFGANDGGVESSELGLDFSVGPGEVGACRCAFSAIVGEQRQLTTRAGDPKISKLGDERTMTARRIGLLLKWP